MRSSPPGIARFDSAAGMVRALADCLHERRFSSISGSRILDRVMPLVNLMPKRGGEWLYSVGGAVEAISPRDLRHLNVDRICEWIVSLFPARTYPAAVVGSSNGALVHLAAAIGAPWLPQTFLCPVRQPGTDPDDARSGFERGLPIVETLTATQPALCVHHMHDPNQDRLMLKTMSYFRLKHRKLPASYRNFLIGSLPCGATLYIAACTRQWPVTRTSQRSVFQFGALGGATLSDYFRGGTRACDYFHRYGCTRSRWEPPVPNDHAPEAEWGFERSLADELTVLARERHWRLVEIRFEEPEAMSSAAAAIIRAWYGDLGLHPHRLLVASFILMDPYSTFRLHAIPFWALFSVKPSVESLERYLDADGPFEHIDIAVFSHGTEGIGLASIEEWRQLALRARRSGQLLGVDPRRYPRDFATFVRYQHAIARLGPTHPLPPPLGIHRFESLLRSFGPVHRLAVSDVM